MSKEWDQANLKTLACRVRTEEAEEFKAYAREKGVTVHSLLSDYVRETVAMKRNMSTSASQLIQQLMADNERLKAANIQLETDKRDLRNMAVQLELRAERAEKLVHDYVLAK